MKFEEVLRKEAHDKGVREGFISGLCFGIIATSMLGVAVISWVVRN